MAMSTRGNHDQRQRRQRSLPLRSPYAPDRPLASSFGARVLALARAALKVVAGASVATSAALALQLVWIVLRTPRLPPPPLSGVRFAREGRVVGTLDEEDDVDCDDDGDGSENYDFIGDVFPGEAATEGEGASNIGANALEQNNDTTEKREEFRLFLVGDSPVEGIGHERHDTALGGRTAGAFARLVCGDGEEGYDCVRYWSLGKSGLTARGIEEEMVPLLCRAVDDTSTGPSPGPAAHAIVVLCGVNNVLDPLSTASSFHSEVRSLLSSIRRRPESERAPLIVLGLPDFARLPFLPWPLSFALGLRARRMQRALETAVAELRRLEEARHGKSDTVLVNIPEVQDVIGSIGYHRHDSTGINANEDGKDPQCKGDNDSEPLKMRLCHPLLKHLGDRRLDQATLGSLTIDDFLCDDGFHPGGHGTVYIGSLIAEAYGKLTNLPQK